MAQGRDGKGPVPESGSGRSRKQHPVSQHTAVTAGSHCLCAAPASSEPSSCMGCWWDTSPWGPRARDSMRLAQNLPKHAHSPCRNLLISFIFWKMPSRLQTLRGF